LIALRVKTLTVSPGENARRGTKLTPLPSEWTSRRPPWRPLLEPTTRTGPRLPGFRPLKLNVVVFEATGVPGEGKTLTGLGPAAGAAKPFAAGIRSAAARKTVSRVDRFRLMESSLGLQALAGWTRESGVR